MSGDLRLELIDDELGDEALDGARNRFCEFYTNRLFIRGE